MERREEGFGETRGRGRGRGEGGGGCVGDDADVGIAHAGQHRAVVVTRHACTSGNDTEPLIIIITLASRMLCG